MRKAGIEQGIVFEFPKDSEVIDFRKASEAQLWKNFIHDSREYQETYGWPEKLRQGNLSAGVLSVMFFTPSKRAARSVYYTGGFDEEVNSKELEVRWRERNGLPVRIEELSVAPGAHLVPQD